MLKEIAVFDAHAPVVGKGSCGIADPVTLKAVALPDGSQVALHPPALLRCDFATAIVNWVREDVAPVAAQLGSALRSIENYDSYDCRGRNRVVGAKISEHGRGNALDVKSIRLADGTVAALTDPHIAKDVRDELHRSACSRFMTVLGPGSDGYHEQHIHVDLAPRHNNYRICQWDVRQPAVTSREPTRMTVPPGLMERLAGGMHRPPEHNRAPASSAKSSANADAPMRGGPSGTPKR